MASGQEDLSASPLFQYLQDNSAVTGILDDAPSQSFIVCVPTIRSLVGGKGFKVTKKWALKHVLMRQGPSSRIYKSLSGGMLELAEDGKTLQCKKGYSDNKRSCHILFEETHYNDDFESFQVVCISLPFDGKFNKYTSGEEERKIMEVAECRSMAEHNQFLVSLLGRNFVTNVIYRNKILLEFQAQMDKLLADTLSGENDGLATVEKEMCGVSDRLFRHVGSQFRQKIKDEDCVSLYDAVYSMVTSSLHGHLFEALKFSKYARDRDAKLAQILLRVKDVRLSDLGVEKHLTGVNVDKAVDMINGINMSMTPLIKLKCLRDVEEFLIVEIGHAMKAASEGEMKSNTPFSQQQVQPTMTPPTSSPHLDQALHNAMARLTGGDEGALSPPAEAQENKSNSAGPSVQGVSTDEVLPFFVYVLIKSSVQFPVANFLYISHFLPPIHSPKLDVLLAHLQAAISYVELDELHIEGPLQYSDTSKKNLALLLGMSHQDPSSLAAGPSTAPGSAVFSPVHVFNNSHRLNLTGGNANLFSASNAQTPSKASTPLNSAFSPSPTPSLSLLASSANNDTPTDTAARYKHMAVETIEEGSEFPFSSSSSSSSNSSTFASDATTAPASAPSSSYLALSPAKRTSAIGVSPSKPSGLTAALKHRTSIGQGLLPAPRTRGAFRSKSVDILSKGDLFESKSNPRALSLLHSLTDASALLDDSSDDDVDDEQRQERVGGSLRVPRGLPKHKRAMSTFTRSRQASVQVKETSKVTIDPLSFFQAKKSSDD